MNFGTSSVDDRPPTESPEGASGARLEPAPRVSPVKGFARVGEFLEMIKVGHTLFALPFAIGATVLAAGGWPTLLQVLQICLAVLFARTAAMAFNRYVDREIDAENPRTETRSLPTGALTPQFVLLTVFFSSAAFIATAATIGTYTGWLSPVALVIILGYSVTKRVTSLCHLALGAALALAPIGAWVAIRGTLQLDAWILGAAVMFWTAGFDILYSTLDVDFDRSRGLNSIPVRWGIPGALRIAMGFHFLMVALLIALGLRLELGAFYFGTLVAVVAVLTYEHRLVKPDDLARVNQAFFLWNVVISVALMVAMIVESSSALPPIGNFETESGGR